MNANEIKNENKNENNSTNENENGGAVGAGVDVEAETAAVRRVVAAVEHAQRNELPEEFISLFRADAIWTTGHGKLLVGREAIAEFTRKVLPGAFAGTGTTPAYEVVHVLFVRPDVAAVKVRQRYLDAAGEQIGEEGSPLYVMAKEGGRWLLTANQNTLVQSS
ncbi:SgcJ/EcaC family oxidoreductase [Streptomyces sp. BE20]|uniref:SgcJ/EcaC family oxidoreductase n=1 Tax=Streptomyces sp. BE20 TaxID=3002525 RepID=UPI002E77F2B8|nr:SgcJ/EcaC family oxidoreductase [Streptomyces sp. BE20]MEE1823527.1 SgcJ/EcaC family oxidoreductase [Streptomyces sp. BE20]